MSQKTNRFGLARTLAPDDVRVGGYVSVLDELYEFSPFSSCSGDHFQRAPKPLRVRFLPSDCDPMKVVSVCLPFVLVESVEGKCRTLDVRQHKLAQLDRTFGQAAFEHQRQYEKRQKKDD